MTNELVHAVADTVDALQRLLFVAILVVDGHLERDWLGLDLFIGQHVDSGRLGEEDRALVRMLTVVGRGEDGDAGWKLLRSLPQVKLVPALFHFMGPHERTQSLLVQ